MSIWLPNNKQVTSIFANVNGEKKEIVSGWVNKEGAPVKVFGKGTCGGNNALLITVGKNLYVYTIERGLKQICTNLPYTTGRTATIPLGMIKSGCLLLYATSSNTSAFVKTTDFVTYTTLSNPKVGMYASYLNNKEKWPISICDGKYIYISDIGGFLYRTGDLINFDISMEWQNSKIGYLHNGNEYIFATESYVSKGALINKKTLQVITMNSSYDIPICGMVDDNGLYYNKQGYYKPHEIYYHNGIDGALSKDDDIKIGQLSSDTSDGLVIDNYAGGIIAYSNTSLRLLSYIIITGQEVVKTKSINVIFTNRDYTKYTIGIVSNNIILFENNTNKFYAINLESDITQNIFKLNVNGRYCCLPAVLENNVLDYLYNK